MNWRYFICKLVGHERWYLTREWFDGSTEDHVVCLRCGTLIEIVEGAG